MEEGKGKREREWGAGEEREREAVRGKKRNWKKDKPLEKREWIHEDRQN